MKKYDLGVPRNGTSSSGSNLLHLHAVTDVDQNGETGKRTEAADARGRKMQQSIIYIERLQQVLRLWRRQGQPCGARLGVSARSQIRDPALKLGADKARVGHDDARSTSPSPKPLGVVLGRD